MKNLKDLTLKRRSTRKYTEQKIDDKTINKILDIALTAPSSWGQHPIHFIVIKDKKMIKK